MGRKIKYSKELKLEIVKRYLKGESASTLAKDYFIAGAQPNSLVYRWVHKYEQLGESAFESSDSNKAYCRKLKENVIKEYLNGGISYCDLANIYGISTGEIVRGWVLKYNSGIEIKDYDPKGDVYTMKARKTTLEEKLEIINYVLSHDNDYKGAADIYSVPYANVYSWIKKYNELGEDGLKDSRGRPTKDTSTSEFTNEQKLQLENEKLRHDLQRQKMINEVLKKNIEIQEQMDQDSRLLNKKINTRR